MAKNMIRSKGFFKRKMGVSRPYLALRIIEFALGVICFGLDAKFGLMFDDSADGQYIERVKTGIQYVAADGFPFLIQIPFLIALWRHGRIFQHNILNPIVNLAGCVLYATAGSMAIAVIHRNMDTYSIRGFDEKRQQYAIGSMFIITGNVYLLDLLYWIIKFRKEPRLT